MKFETKKFLSLLAYQAAIGLSSSQENNGLRIPERRELKSTGRRLQNFECTLLIKSIAYDENHGEEIPECLLPGENIPRPFANIPDWLKEKFQNDQISSNVDSLLLSEAFVRNKKIYIPSMSKASLVKGTDERARHLQGNPPSRTLMAMRITNAGQTQPSYSNSGFAESIFGDASVDPFNLRIGYEQCSYGKLTFTPGSSNGVVDVNTAVTNDDNVITDEALSLTGWSNNGGPHDYVMACLPNDTFNNGSTGWIAYAYINHWLSVYKGPWCAYPSGQMHEIGHNLNLAHSGETSSYDDKSGMMGYSYSSDDTPVMCFNGPKNWQLGWYSDRHIALTNGASWSGKVYGLSAYQSSSPGDAVVIKIDASPDIYVSYNKKSGINSGTQEGGNQLLVHTKANSPSAYGVSVLVAKLNIGDSTTVLSNSITFLSSGGDYAVVEIGDGQITASPTSAPSASPTQSPTPPPTTASPTSDPTASPTQSPMTPGPTFSPTSLPTENCSAIGRRKTCINTDGCSWEKDGQQGGGGFCQPGLHCPGKRVPCVEKDGCYWKSSGDGTGRCKKCSTIGKKNNCDRNTGCDWIDGVCA